MQIVKEKVGSGNSSLYLVYARPLSPIGSLFSSTTNPSDCPKNKKIKKIIKIFKYNTDQGN